MKNKILLVLLAMVLVVSLAAFGACAAPVEEEEKAPLIEEKAPAVKEKAPLIEEKAPAVKEKAPVVKEKAPPKEEKAPPVVEEVWQWPDKLTIAVTSPASLGYAVGIGWSTPMAKDSGMKIRMAVEDSSILRFAWIKQGLFFVTGHDTAEWFMEADGMWANRDGGPFQVRSVYPIGGSESMLEGEVAAISGFAVRGDSGIKTPHDIKPGMKIVYISFAPQGRWVMEYLLAWAQVDPEDVTWVPAATIAANTRVLVDGRGDVAVGYPTSAAWYEAEASPHGLDWIELNPNEDPEGAQRYIDANPSPVMFGKFEQGVPSAIGKSGLAQLAGGYVTRADTDPELVYHFVKWMDENHDKYKDAHPNCEYMTIPVLMVVAERSWVPIHDGVIKYLEEKGLWTPAHQKRHEEKVDVITKYVEAYEAAISLADEKGIEVSTANTEWTEMWKNYRQEVGLPRFKYYPAIE